MWWNLSLSHYRGDENTLIDNGFEVCHVFFASPTPLKSHFKAVFSSNNRLRALIDAILLLEGRCHVGPKNANRLHARRWHAVRSLTQE